MAKYLKNAPLVHAAVQLRYSKIPELTEPSSVMSTGVAKEMVDIGFQEIIESVGHSIVIKASKAENTPARTDLYRFIFRATGQTASVVLSDDSVILKTTSYTHFDDFSKTFDDILSVLERTIQGFSKSVVRNIGFRYSNLIAPIGDTTLDDYLVDDILPVKNIFDSNDTKIGITQSSVSLGENKSLRLLLQEVLTVDGKVTRLIPDELLEPDPKAGLLVQGYKHWAELSAPRYALLDLDHVYEFPASPIYSKALVTEHLNDLHTQAGETFWKLITPKAKIDWQETTR